MSANCTIRNKMAETNGRIGWTISLMPGWRYTRLRSKTYPFLLKTLTFDDDELQSLPIERRYADT